MAVEKFVYIAGDGTFPFDQRHHQPKLRGENFFLAGCPLDNSSDASLNIDQVGRRDGTVKLSVDRPHLPGQGTDQLSQGQFFQRDGVNQFVDEPVPGKQWQRLSKPPPADGTHASHPHPGDVDEVYILYSQPFYVVQGEGMPYCEGADKQHIRPGVAGLVVSLVEVEGSRTPRPRVSQPGFYGCSACIDVASTGSQAQDPVPANPIHSRGRLSGAGRPPAC